MNKATCPVCNKQLELYAFDHFHHIGKYIVYYDDDRDSKAESLTTVVYNNGGSVIIFLDLKGFVYLDEQRIETYLLLK